MRNQSRESRICVKVCEDCHGVTDCWCGRCHYCEDVTTDFLADYYFGEDEIDD